MRNIPDLPGYAISEDGEVIGPKGRPIKGRLGNAGYWRYYLYQNGVQRWFLAHRLVAHAYMGMSLSDERDVHHLDGVKLHNHFTNLSIISRGLHNSITAAMAWPFDTEDVKQCRTCRRILARIHFGKDSAKSDGQRHSCKSCINVMS